MTWDEWEQLKAEALQNQRTDMRLNSAADPGGGRSGDAPDLRTNAPGKKAAVKALRERIRPGATTAGNHADETSSAAVREFKDWDTGAGLKDAHKEWELQVKQLKARLEADQAALAKTKSDFQYVDFTTGNRIAQAQDQRRDA
ncbi:hypothetical protein [Streptomyces coffeae]|uniref:Uncharacterized protein n=1 Tax=Streptomyces coffeae TaxID=621382 RepID=A0ABS1N9J2_9ACTN|nr:hypothetical protein [Streptomyces coffeae]MBL1096622.1 hypothetical protein [Streptomyces coffeae]